jgi:HD-like signal output (HDOD) protein
VNAAPPAAGITPNDGPLQKWVRKLADEEMPVFAQTVGEINKILTNEEFSSLSLARVILQDPSMTAKVLKLANSAFYNPGGTAISTISRAVVVLGFNAVQAICITIAIIESLVRGPAKDRVMRELARAIHAATQARNLAMAQKDPTSEEVFIAALLLNLGQMAFWCFAGEEGSKLDKALQDDPRREPVDVEKEVLGFKLSHLTSALAQEWHLTSLVEEGMKGISSSDPRGRWIDLAHRVARESENGWTSPGMRLLATEVAKVVKGSVTEVGPMLERCAGEAVETARAMGAGSAARLIPVARKDGDPESNWDAGTASPFPPPDPMLQLKILRDITTTITTKPDLNVILEMVLEGVHRGVGMDRTVLALVSPRKNLVKAKHVLGADRMRMTDKFWFELGRPEPGPLAKALYASDATWFDAYGPAVDTRESVFETIDHAPFFAAPVLYSGQVLGMFYADRGPSGRPLDVDAFESFKLFVHQANMGLEHVARQRLAAAK